MLTRAVIAALCWLGLCAFDMPPFDLSAVPKAQSAFQLALAACGKRTDYKTIADNIDCILTADREFTVTIHFRDSSLFDSYAAKVNLLCDGVRGQTLAPADARARFLTLQNEFFVTLRGRYTDYQSATVQDYLRDSEPAPRQSGSMNDMSGGMGGM